ncbi:TlyA family RNA methyltransferase [Herbiconiux sp. SYSU D00978]|uniref:TlyA family RNA methyltransferase n=1 Tax=Herbiconiux sp. SYSU D00978 TaxID=2812562 RepID=UPI001A96C8A6|nr:TlyA family RNA methyltransferase [Herbiconiux sp. SYSU D00978]
MSDRLDAALAARGLARSRTHAARLIADGLVTVDGEPAVKASAKVGEAQELAVAGADHYVSRAAHKLIAALDGFAVDPASREALDLGASTGGFTQVLLERGAAHVVAVDVGHGQLAPEIAGDHRVSVVEGYNVRYATRESLEGAARRDIRADLVVGDLSFISLRTVLPAIVTLPEPEADFVLLVKPQFEVGREGIREGIVRNEGLRREAVEQVLWAAWDLGLGTAGVLSSPLPGAEGNREYLVRLSRVSGGNPTEWLDRVGAITGG